MLDKSQYSDPAEGTKVAEQELKATLEALAAHLFGTGIEVVYHPSCHTASILAVRTPKYHGGRTFCCDLFVFQKCLGLKTK